MVVVIVIIGLLVAVAIPVVSNQLEKVQANACAGDREAARNLVAAAIQLDDSFLGSLYDGEPWDTVAGQLRGAGAYLTDISCPSGGTFSIEKGDHSVSVVCSKHTGGGDIDIETPSQGLLKDFISYLEAHQGQPNSDNSSMRGKFFEENGNKWPTMTIDGGDGTVYQYEPFFQTNTRDPQNTWLFARVGDGTNLLNSWYVPLVYDPIDDVWYQRVRANGTPDNYSITSFANTQSLHDEVSTSRLWKAVRVTYLK